MEGDGATGLPVGSVVPVHRAHRREAGGARWREFTHLDDPTKAVWQVPPERFKSNATHLVALSGDAQALLATVPRFRSGDHLFSASFGETPTLQFHAGKARLDALMLRYLKALARLRGDEHWARTELAQWQTHDLRRVVRTKLAALEVNDTIAELVVGHAKRGLQRVYDQHSYAPQMRRALEAWAAELRRIILPRVGDGVVVPLRAKGA